MPDTGFSVPARDLPRLAQLYRATPSGGLTPDAELAATLTQAGRGHFGGGGLVSTTADYMRFAAMLLNRGTLDGIRILSPQTVGHMLRSHLPGGLDSRRRLLHDHQSGSTESSAAPRGSRIHAADGGLQRGNAG